MDNIWDDDLKKGKYEAGELKQALTKVLSESKASNTKRHEATIRNKLALLTKTITDLEGLLREMDNPDFTKLNQLNELYTVKTEAENYLKKYSPIPQMGFSQDRIINTGNEDILTSRHELLMAQDIQLDSLDGSSTNIRNYSTNIRDEVSLHSRLLQDVGEDMDRTQSLVNRNYRLFSEVVSKSSLRWLYITIFLLTTILIILIFGL